jgi:DNA-binding transcriptional MerR regulator
MASKAPEGELIYISQLAKIVNREIGTIRKWEREGKLPKHLLPRRGERGWRCWTHAQVYGERGIIKWMKKHDMRPGREFSDPANADDHVRHLRRPKYLNKHLILLARNMVKNKETATAIAEELYPHTRYASSENLEEALRRYFTRQGWVFPRRDRPTKRSLNAAKKRLAQAGKQ